MEKKVPMSDSESEKTQLLDSNFLQSLAKKNDLSTFDIPEKRNLTVSYTQITDFINISETYKPDQAREIINSMLDGLINALITNQANVNKISADEVVGLHGAPQYFEDHALRAVLTAGQQMESITQLKDSFQRRGLHFLGCGTGIDTGPVIIGSIGLATQKHNTAMGRPINISKELSSMAGEGEILITENTLNSILGALPPQFDISWPGIDPLASEGKSMISLGFENKERITFHYMQSLKIQSTNQNMAVYKAVINNPIFTKHYLQDESKGQSVKLFGKYKLQEKLGKGGMGEVWRGEDQFGNVVAIKIARSGEKAKPPELDEFKKEAEIMSRLSHRGICKIYEVGQAENINYISMEYIEGTTLSKILKFRPENDAQTQEINLHTMMENIQKFEDSGKPYQKPKQSIDSHNYFPPDVAVELVLKLCSAISYAHDHNVYHRDIKPQNIIINKEHEPVVMDFGIAKVDTSKNSEPLNNNRQIYGTIEYMSPEQAEANVIDNQKADIYAIGAVFYQMLTGTKHFHSSKNLAKDLQTLQDHTPPTLRSKQKNITSELEAIVLKTLKNSPGDRYNTVEELKDDLNRYQQGQPISIRRSSYTYQFKKLIGRHIFESVLLSIIALLVIIASVWVKKDVSKATGNWILIQRIDFSNERESSKKIITKNSLNKPSSHENIFLSDGIHLQPHHWMWLKAPPRHNSSGNIKIKLNLTFHSLPNSFRMLINSKGEAVKSREELPEGTILEVGMHFGSIDNLTKKTKGKVLNAYNTQKSSLKMGSPVEIILEQTGENTIYKKNGLEILSLRDPLSSNHLQPPNIGFQTFSENVVIHSLSLYRQSLPEETSSLNLAEGLIKTGNPEEAFFTLMNLFVDFRHSPLGSKALFKAYQVAREHPGGLSKYLEKVKSKMEENYPTSPLLTQIYELEAIDLYRAKQFKKFQHKFTLIQKRNPQSPTPIYLNPHYAPRSTGLSIIKSLENLGGVSSFQIPPGSSLHLQDFQNIIASRVNIEGTRTQSLAPLRGFPLTWINISQNNIMDIDILKGKFIRYFQANHNKISNIEALRGMQLEYVMLDYNNISDVTPLKQSPLKLLHLSGNRIHDVEGLNISQLIDLKLSDNQIQTMPLLVNTPLQTLNLENNNITQTAFLSESNVSHLNLNNNQIMEISHLAKLPLKTLQLERNPLVSVLPIKNLKLHYLNLSNTPLTDLAELNPVMARQLDLSGIPLENTNPLISKRLHDLRAENCNLKSLDKFKSLSLKRLSVSHNQITELSEPNLLSLQYLNVENNPLKELGPLAAAPPDTFLFYNAILSEDYLLQLEQSWSQNTTSPFNLHYLKTAQGIKKPEEGLLKQWAKEFKGHFYLHVPIKVTFQEAMNIAQKSGGHLATLQSEEENNFIYSILQDNSTQWLGIIQQKGQWAWLTGEPTSYLNTSFINESKPDETLVYGGIFHGGRWIKQVPDLKTGFIIEWEH